MIIKYVNSINKEFEFSNASIIPTNGYLHKRKWNQEKINGKTTLNISDYTYTITLTLRGSLEERKKKLDEICDILDYDCSVVKEGTLYYGDYKIKCFVITSNTSISSVNTRTDIELGIYCPKHEWIKEKHYNLIMFNEGKNKSNEKRYTYTYPFIYSNQKGITQIVNDSLIDSDFLLRIHGPCMNPFVKIGEYVYQINTTLNNNEYLEIDSNENEIFSYSKYGDKRNLFPYRSKSRANFFEKIRSGYNLVSWPGTFKAELIMYEKRGEPKWSQ